MYRSVNMVNCLTSGSPRLGLKGGGLHIRQWWLCVNDNGSISHQEVGNRSAALQDKWGSTYCPRAPLNGFVMRAFLPVCRSLRSGQNGGYVQDGANYVKVYQQQSCQLLGGS